MAARGIVRATQDIDFFVAPEPGNVERLIGHRRDRRACRHRAYALHVAEVDRAGGRRADVPGRLVQHVGLDG
jgi:hypothetical protein